MGHLKKFFSYFLAAFCNTHVVLLCVNVLREVIKWSFVLSLRLKSTSK